jgi:DNA polymerase III epsilon subunit-like protein
MNQKTGKYLAIDTEFTGNLPHVHGLVEVGYVILDETLQELSYRVLDVCPPEGYQIDPQANALMNFDTKRIASGKTYKQFVNRFTKDIQLHCSHKPILIGHFLPMDFAYLNQVFDSVGKSQDFWRDVLGHSIIDTKSIANEINLKATLRGERPPFVSTSLSAPGGLKDTLGITGYEAHTALGDVRATIEVLKKLLEFS